MNTQQFSNWIAEFVNQPWVSTHRRIVLLKGDEQWAYSLLTATPIAQQLLDDANSFIYGDSSLLTANVPYKRFRDFLGRESQSIFFSDSQFNFDAFAALSGTLKAGGICFVFLPRGVDLKEQGFTQRFLTYLSKNKQHIIIEQSSNEPEGESELGEKTSQASSDVIKPHKEPDKGLVASPSLADNTAYLGCANQQQFSAVKAISKVLSGHRKRPLVLTADRGRGKSTALAIACVQMMANHKANKEVLRIGVTAPNKQALSVFFQQLTERLPQLAELNGRVDFIAIDDLIQNPHELSLLLVDEAAGIPVYVLQALLENYHRTVFASTVHGYEGAGRGFTLKFTKILHQLTPNWHALHLEKPIRWAENDPLEQLVFDVGLLNANLPTLNEKIVSLCKLKKEQPFHEQLLFEQVDIQKLYHNEKQLAQIFAILVSAHYQTKPSDVKMLLENPKVRLFTLSVKLDNVSHLLGVSLLLSEGGLLDGELSNDDVLDVQQSKRRLRSQFLPQALLTSCAMEDAFNYRYLRVMRIAIHPEIQHMGLGSFFMTQLCQYAKNSQADFIGSSFAANNELLSYWFKQGFKAVRLGFNKDKASGEHSALVLQPFSENAKRAQQVLTLDFANNFRHLLLDEFKDLSRDLTLLLLKHCKATDLPVLSKLDKKKITAFVKEEVLYSHCAYSLYLWFVHALQGDRELDAANSSILVSRIIQKNTIAKVCEQYGLPGKKALNQVIINYVRKYYQHGN